MIVSERGSALVTSLLMLLLLSLLTLTGLQNTTLEARVSGDLLRHEMLLTSAESALATVRQTARRRFTNPTECLRRDEFGLWRGTALWFQCLEESVAPCTQGWCGPRAEASTLEDCPSFIPELASCWAEAPVLGWPDAGGARASLSQTESGTVAASLAQTQAQAVAQAQAQAVAQAQAQAVAQAQVQAVAELRECTATPWDTRSGEPALALDSPPMTPVTDSEAPPAQLIRCHFVAFARSFLPHATAVQQPLVLQSHFEISAVFTPSQETETDLDSERSLHADYPPEQTLIQQTLAKSP